jgi:hypothetical protein
MELLPAAVVKTGKVVGLGGSRVAVKIGGGVGLAEEILSAIPAVVTGVGLIFLQALKVIAKIARIK